MDFTETQAEILVNAWALSSRGCGQVLEAVGLPGRHRAGRGGLARTAQRGRRPVDLVVDARGGGGARHERATPRRPRRPELMVELLPQPHGFEGFAGVEVGPHSPHLSVSYPVHQADLALDRGAAVLALANNPEHASDADPHDRRRPGNLQPATPPKSRSLPRSTSSMPPTRDRWPPWHPPAKRTRTPDPHGKAPRALSCRGD